MNYNVVTFGNDVLRRKAEPVPVVTEEIRRLAQDMLVAMYASNGVGLAAEQVGRTESICVIDVSPAQGDSPLPAGFPKQPMVLINPEIIQAEGKERCQEGCLSFPGIFVNVTRSAKVTVRYMDLDGSIKTAEATKLLGRAIQHELDHLNGVLLVDRMSLTQKMANSGKLRSLKRKTRKELRS